jgi:hypothetical protein
MNVKFFKLVPATEAEIKGKPFVAVWKSRYYTLSGKELPSPEFARHIVQGSASIFGLDQLIVENTP